MMLAYFPIVLIRNGIIAKFKMINIASQMHAKKPVHDMTMDNLFPTTLAVK